MIADSSVDKSIDSIEDYPGREFKKILIPTACHESTISEMYPVLEMLKNQTQITFFHVVPLSTDSLYDCVDLRDINYAMSVAEKKLYSYIKRMPEKKNIVYSYKVSNGKSKDQIVREMTENKYDLIALQIGEIGHFSHSIFDVLELVNLSRIPVLIFGNRDMENTLGDEEKVVEVR